MAKERNAGWSGFFSVFTVLCAIALLLAREGQGLVAAGSGGWQVLSIYEGLTSWSVPAMFMLWGMKALDGGKSGFAAGLRGLVLPCFCQLVFWGALCAVVSHLLGGGSLSWWGIWSALKSAALGNTYFHLWVLYPLLGLYLIHPVLHRFTASASRNEIRYFMALCFLFASVLPVWNRFYPSSAAAALLERLQVHLVLGYVGYYVAGWYLRRYTIGRVWECVIYLLGVAGLALTLLGHQILGGSRALWYGYTAPGVAMTAVALCVLFRYVLGISEERSRRREMGEMGNYVFGAYLFHQIWAMVLRWFGVSVLAFSPVVSIPFFTGVLFLLSIPFGWLLYLIPGAGKWLTE